jgi:hypothetical protein
MSGCMNGKPTRAPIRRQSGVSSRNRRRGV